MVTYQIRESDGNSNQAWVARPRKQITPEIPTNWERPAPWRRGRPVVSRSSWTVHRYRGSENAGMLSKVPEVTFAFWLIKICATTLGETGGDALSMTLELGYAISSAIFFGIFLATVAAQVGARSFHRFRYWAVIVTTTTLGTTMSDYLTRTAGFGYLKSSLLLFALVLLVLGVWYFALGSVSVNRITNRKTECFYWTAILFSNTLGTALGDCLADTTRLGYEGGALVFAAALALVAAAYFWSNISHTILFWAAFILTRPLGATLGDLLTKPVAHGGLNLSRISSSAVIAAFIVGAIFFTSREAGSHPGADELTS